MFEGYSTVKTKDRGYVETVPQLAVKGVGWVYSSLCYLVWKDKVCILNSSDTIIDSNVLLEALLSFLFRISILILKEYIWKLDDY